MKIIGCIIVIITSSYVGFYLACKETVRLMMLEEIYRFTRSLKDGIDKRLTLKEIATRYTILEKPKYLKGNSRDEILKSLFTIEKSGLCPKATSVLKSLLSAVGKSSDAGEIFKKCAESLDVTKEMLISAREEYKRKKPLYLKLGAVLGVLVCVTVI